MDSRLEHLDDVRNKLAQVSSSFCMAKWNQVTIHLQNGHTHSCHHPDTHRVPLTELARNPSALHNTVRKKHMRKQMLDGQRPPECQYCWNIEDASADSKSDRLFKSAAEWSWPDYEKITTSDPSSDIQPSYLEVSFSNRCNFKCSYCLPNVSSKWMEEIKQHGPYPTQKRQNNLEYLRKVKKMPIEESKNPYVDAFWKWWPELYPALRVFRITGGEPLLSPNTFRVLELIIEKPNPNLVLAINTNLSVPEKQLDRFLELAEQIVREGKVRSLEIHTSIDSWGKQAEYIRHGLNCEIFSRNVERVLNVIPALSFNLMVTYNIFSLFNFNELLNWTLELKRKHIESLKQKQITIDISYLRSPEFQSVRILPLSFTGEIEKSILFMQQHFISQQSVDGAAGFSADEIQKLVRIVEWMKTPVDDEWVRGFRVDFVRFFREHDRRRGTNIHADFPELLEFWNECVLLETIEVKRQKKEMAKARKAAKLEEIRKAKMRAELMAALRRWRRKPGATPKRVPRRSPFRKRFKSEVAPFGYAFFDGKLVVHPKEGASLQQIFILKQLGFNVDKIVQALNLKRAPGPDKKKWDKKTVSALIRKYKNKKSNLT
jgi:pyruvate-formate lyase-activating enzyme